MSEYRNQDGSKVNTTIGVLCHGCAQYIANNQFRGKSRDANTLSFFAGSALSLAAAKHPDADKVSAFALYLIATRGYSEVERILKNNP